MRHRTPLPDDLGPRFAVRDAAANGVGRRRLDARDLERPFHGVRAVAAPTCFRDRVRAYAPRLRDGQHFGGVTAARLWGLPHPTDWSIDEDLVIVVTTEGSAPPPRTAGVKGRRLARRRFRRWRMSGLPVVDPVAALLMCAHDLEESQLIRMIDAAITRARHYPGRHKDHPAVSIAEIEQRIEEWGRFPGRARITAALAHAREHVESPKETETRLAVIDAGLPEPVIQYTVFDSGRFVARVDLAYPKLRIAIEYEGDGHRTGKTQWRIDIRRQRELEALGWIVIRVTELDLADSAHGLIVAVRHALARRLA